MRGQLLIEGKGVAAAGTLAVSASAEGLRTSRAIEDHGTRRDRR
jgi:hypothetical protein